MLPRTCATLVLGWIGRHFREWSKILELLSSLGSLSCRDVLTPHQGRTAPVETNGRVSPPPPVSCHLPPSCSQKQHTSATAVHLTNQFCSFDLSVEHGVEIRTPRTNLPLHQATNAILLLLQQQCQTPHRVLSRHRSHHIIIIKQQAIALRQLR